MSGNEQEDLESRKRQNKIIADFDREAHQIIQSFVDVYELNGKYEVTDFSVRCISSFLMEWHFNDAIHKLPEGAWAKAIKMYMRLIEIDYDYLEEVHAMMRRTH